MVGAPLHRGDFSMNAPFRPTTAHAVFSMSSAHRWAEEDGCSASAEAIAALGEQPEGDEAAEGTQAHDEIERILGPYSGDGLGLWFEHDDSLVEPLNYEHPAAYGIALFVDYVRRLAPGALFVEQYVKLTEKIWGRLDLGHWDAESATVTVADFKNGFVGVDAERNAQLRGYAASLILNHSLPARWIRYAVVQPNDFRPVPRVKQWIEPIADLNAWSERVAKIPDGPKRFVAGKQCTYCPLFGRCEASRDILRDVGALVAGLMTPDQVSPKQRMLFMACKKPIADAFKGAEKVWLDQALAGTSAPGLAVVTEQPHRKWKNEAAAKEALFAANGLAGLEAKSPAQAEKMGFDTAGRFEKPRGGPVLAFASDKRPVWEPRSSKDMFGALLTG